MIYDELTPIQTQKTIIDPIDPTRFRTMDSHLQSEDLLIPIFKNGECIYKLPSLTEIQNYAKNQIKSLHHSIQRLELPHYYPAGLEKNLHELKTKLILEAKEKDR